MNDSSLTRFSDKIERIPFSTCWHWLGALDRDGYAQFRLEGRAPMAHRVAYEHFVGPIGGGLEIDHLCKNRSCVNPVHLQPVPHAENVRRGDAGKWLAQKTHCPSGHRYSPENTRLKKLRNGRFGRSCITCVRRLDRESKMLKRRASLV